MSDTRRLVVLLVMTVVFGAVATHVFGAYSVPWWVLGVTNAIVCVYLMEKGR